jgi:hypothetical protein
MITPTKMRDPFTLNPVENFATEKLLVVKKVGSGQTLRAQLPERLDRNVPRPAKTA